MGAYEGARFGHFGDRLVIFLVNDLRTASFQSPLILRRVAWGPRVVFAFVGFVASLM